jgi:hypothetical protein
LPGVCTAVGGVAVGHRRAAPTRAAARSVDPSVNAERSVRKAAGQKIPTWFVSGDFGGCPLMTSEWTCWLLLGVAHFPPCLKGATVLTAVKDPSGARAAARRPAAVLDLRCARWRSVDRSGREDGRSGRTRGYGATSWLGLPAPFLSLRRSMSPSPDKVGGYRSKALSGAWALGRRRRGGMGVGWPGDRREAVSGIRSACWRRR